MKKIRIPIIVATFLAFFFFYAHTTHAFISTSPLKDELKADEYQAGSSVFNTTTKTIESLNALILGTGDEEVDKKLGASALQTTTGLIAALYGTPPASSAYYLADLGQRLNLIQPAYAQGIGYNGLRPLLPLWKASRNAAYMIIIFVSLLVGLGIMLRIKISPQAAITIQAAIPKVVIALILVTFSYAIAGLMIDLTYLTTGISVSLIEESGVGEKGGTETLIDFLKKNNLSEGIENLNSLEYSILFLGKGASSVKKISQMLNPFAFLASFLPDTLDKFVTEFTKSFPPTQIFTVSESILAFLLGIILLYAFFKLFLSLLLNYIQIIIHVLIAPFTLMISAIPGQNTFGKWLRGLAQNLLPFPAVITMLALSGRITSLSNINKLWVAPLIRPPLFGLSKLFPAILRFGFILLATKIPDAIKSMFEKKPFQYGAAIGEPIKTGIGATIAGVKKGYESLPSVQKRRALKEAVIKKEAEEIVKSRTSE